MCALNQRTEKWLEKDLIPKLKSLFNKSECEVKYKTSIPKNSQFLSTLFFLDLEFTDGQGKCENKIHMVVKRPSSEEFMKDWVNFEGLFHNEILFYTKCAQLYTCGPEFFYICEEAPDQSSIVVKNLCTDGYHLNSVRVNVSNKYMLAAVRELARFHAIGYDLKQKKPVEFLKIVKEIRGFEQIHTNRMAALINCGMPRIFQYLRKEKHDQVFCDKLESFLRDAYSNAIIGLSKPVEPLATLCHGDFTVNNILYKEENEHISIKLIDFSMISYCSPFIDFSLFLLLSGTREQWKDKFPEVFGVYCDTLLQCLKEHGVSNLETFSKECLLEDYKRHAIFGYVIACFFRPTLMGCYGSNTGHLKNMAIEEKCKLHGSIGGDEVTKILSDMLLDLKEIGCLDQIINK